jgi:hypothetical protein
MPTEIESVRSTGPLVAEADFRALRAHEKRLGGFSWDVVAQEIGYHSAEDARQSVKAYLQRSAMRVSENSRRESLEKELNRLDALQSACWDDALSGDLKAIETSLKIINQRSRLLGLEELSQTNVSSQTILIRGDKNDYIKGLTAISEKSK